ncbi:MAG: VWA domain-containing protein [Nocardioides sp.]
MAPPSPHARYQRYAGGDPLAPPVDLSEALSAIGEDVMYGYSPERALNEYLRRGAQDRTGLDELAGRIAERRRELLSEHRLDGTLAEVAELLNKAITAERGQLARDIELDDMDRSFRELQLDNLPTSTAAAVTELSKYDWTSSEAREHYEQIRDLLGRELLDQRFAGMKQALENATDEDRAAAQEMLAALNDLLEAHRRGEDTDQAFKDFMDRFGDYFPENPRTIEELLDTLAVRAAAAQRLRNSLSPEQRAELDQLAAEAFGSQELISSLSTLDEHLQALRPDAGWGGSENFRGEQGVGLGEGTGLMSQLGELDALSEQLGQAYPGARLSDVDLDALARQLGDRAAADARDLANLERALRDSGLMAKGVDGNLRLTPAAMRQLGKELLRDVAKRLSGRQGQRDARRSGITGEPSGSTRAWEFGDTEPWDVTRTLTNAVRREAGDPRGGAGRVRIEVGDVEVTETEARTQACVALCVDTSFSMVMEGWVPMKRTALALHTLIRTRFRGDALELIAFGRAAQKMSIEELTGLPGRYEKGTNLHHALLLANRHFRKHPSMQPVLLIVTDGEPTSHLEPGGEVHFSYPPHPLTLAYAVRELDGAARLGAHTTFFRLGDDPGLARFVDSMARRVRGRVVAPEMSDLGAAVVGSYLGTRAQETWTD